MLEGKYPVTEAGNVVGELEVSRWGPYIRFRALCTSRCREVQRLAVLCAGRQIPLGVLTPSGSGWLLDRRFSPESLRRMGLSRVDGCCILGAEEAWMPENAPELLVEDALLQQLFRGLEGVLSRREGKQMLLALPLEADVPFPAMAIFCFMEAVELFGKAYGLFRLEEGSLRMKEE